MKKKVTILFNGSHLSYSPTTIGLYDLLSERFDVTIIAHNPQKFNNEVLPNRKVIYLNSLITKTQYRATRILFKLLAQFDKDTSLLKRKKVATDIFHEFAQIKKLLLKEPPDFLIAIDLKNLWYAQILNRKVEFVSLELNLNDGFYNRCSFENINSVIIQTEERYVHLFQERKYKTFFIQNAPVYTAFDELDKRERKGLVYSGTAWNPFGFYHCLEFVRQFPEYTLTVKGALLKEDQATVTAKYQNLLSSGRLIIDDGYLDDKEVVSYLRQFRIGFCFYNFEVDWVNTFNYHSAPSGKMFKYFAAGVPVIGQNISGLSPVKEFDCGVLIEDLKPESIQQAIDKIECNFDYYSNNCLKAAAHYSFDKTAQPFIDYLSNQ